MVNEFSFYPKLAHSVLIYREIVAASVVNRLREYLATHTVDPKRREYIMQDVRRGMSDIDLEKECHRLESLKIMARHEQIRLEIIQDELVRRQSRAPLRRQE